MKLKIYSAFINSLLLELLVVLSIQSVICDIPEQTASDNFKSPPTTVRTNTNDTVLLPCYHNSPYRSIRWLRDEEIIVDTTKLENHLESGTKIQLHTNGSLELHNINVDDTGEYSCEIVTSGGLATQIHAIEVQVPANANTTPSGKVELRVGAIFEIYCDVRGTPAPLISWRVNGEIDTENANQRKYLVEIKDRSMAGPIECVANNKVGNPAVSGIMLIVLFAPEIKVTTSFVHTKLGMRAHLECYTTATPAAKVHWFRRGSPVVSNTRINRHDIELNSNRTSPQPLVYNGKHTLIIKNVLDTDLGGYECRAENVIGFNGMHFELTGRPHIPTFKSAPATLEPLSHNLIWQTDSLSSIFEYLLKFRQLPTTSHNINTSNRYAGVVWRNLTVPADISDGPIHTTGYFLRGLQPASIYEVTVKARNQFGWSDASKIIRFATGGEIQIPSYSTETVDYEDVESEMITEQIADYNLETGYQSTDNDAVSKCAESFFMIFITFSFISVFL